MINMYTILIRKPQSMGDQCLAERVILKLILEKVGVRLGTGLNWVRIWFAGGILPENEMALDQQ
jgi:hypothetical protein